MPLSDDFSVSQANATDSTVPHCAALQPAVQRDGGVQPAPDEPASPVPRRHSEIRNSFKTCQCLSFSPRKDKRLPRFSLKLEYMQCLKSKNQNFKIEESPFANWFDNFLEISFLLTRPFPFSSPWYYITVILHFNRRKIPCRLFYKLEPLPMRQLTHHYYLCLSLPPQTRVIGVMTNLSLLRCSTGALILSLG